ncbi:MAG: type II toxin-antitoxin system Phd/YefM family antitoxin [Xanthomonadales bacterium]|jgi:prevent-host-death family protein|nr:type II toxin-antitoxin system Phd/YefM family antitoxin [Pseudoxanthomonas sp.]MBP9645611.1 type II toxin-antitoxin system Phd/YefM family antitoxin [Pseudoxanthomonas sp.]MDZ3798360.1 type II toxin-antitoxin system Phd/YefM family antitoxin [Xanthomonadales bacterium]
MATAINIHEAKTHLSRLVEQACAGEEIIIAKAGKPMARLVPLAPAVKPKTLGLLQGKVGIAADFDAPLPADFLLSRNTV